MPTINQSGNTNFVNPAFKGIFDGVTLHMPNITFYGIIGTYLITAVLNVFFIPLPLYVSIPASVAIVFIRFSIVFMDFLNPTGKKSWQPVAIAFALTVVAGFEFAFSIQENGWGGPKFWATFLFGMSIIAGGYLIEVNFVKKGAEAFNLGNGSVGMLASQDAFLMEFAAMKETMAGLAAENQFLKNQQQQAQAQASTATSPTPAPQGNGQAPQNRMNTPNPALANQGHNGNNPTGSGTANRSMNHHGF